MFRYIAFCWNRYSDVQAQSARRLAVRLEAGSSGWRVRFSGAGIRVYATDERAGASSSIPLQNGYGLVLGTLFERTDAAAPPGRALRTVRPDESVRIADTAGRRLIERYWGRYVAFIQNPETGRVWVIRDPSGALPCLRLQIDEIQIFAADIEDCCDLTPSTFAINWPYVRARVLISYIQTGATGLSGVSQLLPGYCATLHAGQSVESIYWHPCRIAESPLGEDEDDAVESLRNTVTRCVHAWASCHEGILLKLSGGLDSAIILGCLSTAAERPNVICANDYSCGSDTDERAYAKLAADRANCILVERARDSAANLERSLRFRRVSTPVPSHFWVQTHPTNDELAARVSATALFTGNGGDQLFLTSSGHWPIVDYLYYHGPRVRALRMARDAAFLQPPARCQSLWSLMRKAIRLGFFDSKDRAPFDKTPDYSDERIFSREVTETVASEHRLWLPPWLHGTHHLPPGKLSQVHRLSFPNSFYPILHDQPSTLEPTHPLLSQPAIELCLRIPTYVLMSGSTDRTATRKAFEHVLPAEIVGRRSKGGVDNHAVDLLLRNVRFLREFLLDGELTRHQILNRSVVEDVLGGNREGLEIGTNQILNVLQMEAWLRSWTRSATGTQTKTPLNEALTQATLPNAIA